MKGVELGTTKRMSEVIAEVGRSRARAHRRRVRAQPGPGDRRASSRPPASWPASTRRVAELVAAGLRNPPYFRPYTNTDVVGTELGGAVKNVIALAVGMAEGLGMGDNSKASIITRGLAETTRLGMALGADPVTFAGLAGVGDLIATCMSPLSRNHTFGVNLGKGMSVEEVIAVTKQTAEGVKSCESILAARRTTTASTCRSSSRSPRWCTTADGRRGRRRGPDDARPQERDRLTRRVKGAGPAGSGRRAWSRSCQRSSTSSMPTESRSRSSGTVSGSAGCRRRRSICDSTPPRLVACGPQGRRRGDAFGRLGAAAAPRWR